MSLNYDLSGKIAVIRGAFQDITEIMEVREETTRLQQRLAQTLEGMDQAFVLLDKDWRFSFVNAQAELILKSRRADLSWQGHLGCLAPGAQSASFGAGCDRVISTGQPQRFDCYFPKPLTSCLISASTRRRTGWRSTSVTVTDDRAKREQLRLLQLSVSHLNDAVLITEADPLYSQGPKIVYANEVLAYDGLSD